MPVDFEIFKIDPEGFDDFFDERGIDLQSVIEQAFDIAKGEFSVLSDKEISMVAMVGPQVVGATFNSYSPNLNEYGWDTVVREGWRGKGIGTALISEELDYWEELDAELGGVTLFLTVVSPKARNILLDFGLEFLDGTNEESTTMYMGFER